MTFYPADTIWALFELSIRISLIALVVGLALWALRIRGGAVIHAAWTAVIVTMLLLPVLPSFPPAIPIWVPERQTFRQWATRVEAPAPPPIIVAPVRAAEAKAEPLPPAPATTRTAAPVEAPAAPFPWPSALVLVWAIVALALLARLGIGWRRALALAAASEPSSADPALRESDLIATPVTVGVFRPRIILPRGWTAWPAAMQSSVLQHERAHIRRRDTFVNLIAGVNRAVFWFHPLAWWLERRVAVAAEQACDDEVVRASGDSEHYASLLLSMANAVREHGGRVEWQAVGMAGGGSLSQRIDRVMSGVASTPTSRTRRIVLTTACVAAIGFGIACRQTVPPLTPDPAITERLAKQKAEGEKWDAARSMTLDQVKELETQIAKNPEDLDARKRLLTFYQQSGQRLMGWNAMLAARRPHVLYMIEHHPETEWWASWPLKRAYDEDGYAKARALWMAHVSKPDVTAKRLGQAAAFFRISEKPVAEELWLRALAMEPKGPQPRIADNTYYPSYRASLGQLYAQAILGSDDETMGNVLRSVSFEVANGPFATAAKKKLAASSDSVMLRAAGGYLTNNAGRNPGIVGDQKLALGFDFVALGESYLDRAAQLDPNSEETKRFEYYRKVRVLDEVQHQRRKAILTIPAEKVDDPWLAKLSDSDRFEILPELAVRAYYNGENTEYAKKDRAAYEASFARTKKFADETLKLAEQFKADPRYGPSQFTAHVARGLIALREGDRRLAVSHMRAATDGLKPGDVMTSWDTQLYARLGNYLLDTGERETVAYFFERVAQYQGLRGDGLVDAAKAIRAGRMPEGYQYYVTPH